MTRTSQQEAESKERRDRAGGWDHDRHPDTIQTVVRAVQGGLFATVVMTVFRYPILRSLPPSANFWAKYVGGGHPEEYPGIGLLLHLVYGTGAGAVYGIIYSRLEVTPGALGEAKGVVWGGLYGLLLSAFGEHVMLRQVLDMDVEEDAATVFHAGHLVYGLALGAWVGSRMGSHDYREYEESK